MVSAFLPQASTFAGDIDFVINLILASVLPFFLASQFCIFYFCWKFRAKEGGKAQYITGEESHETKWVTYPHFLVLGFDVLSIFFAVQVWYNVKQQLPEADRTVRVVGSQWAWTFVHPGPDGELDTRDDIELNDELHLEEGVVYHYQLQSNDVIHSFSIPAFRLKQDAVPGRTITGWFEPNLVGEYDFQCAEMCGVGHGIMVAKAYVHDAAGHKAWLAEHSGVASLTPTAN